MSLLELFGACYLVSVAAIALWLQVRDEREWTRVALQLQLTATRRWHGLPVLRGILGAISVTARPSGQRSVFEARHGSAPRLSITPRVYPRDQALRTGDEEFDRRVMVHGDELEAIARMSREVRSMLRRKITTSCYVEEGTVYLSKPRWLERAKDLTQDLEEAVRLADLVGRSLPALDEALAYNAVADPIPEVRERNLRLLWARFPASPATARAFRHSLADPVPRLRLAAASALEGPESDAVLSDLREDPALPDDLRCAALAQCARVFPRPVAFQLLEQFVVRGPVAMVLEALRCAGRIGHRALLEKLAEHSVVTIPLVQQTYAVVLGELPAPPLEKPLLHLLAVGVPEGRVAAARSLGKVGTVAAVPALVLTARDLLPTTDLRNACEQAVAKIRERAAGQGADLGQLSLHQAEPEGRLSLAGEEGALSMAPQAGALSLAEDRR